MAEISIAEQKSFIENQKRIEREKDKAAGTKYFFEITAKFKKEDQYKNFNCLIHWHDREGAIMIAEQYFDDFIKEHAQGFEYKIVKCLIKELLFVAETPKREL